MIDPHIDRITALLTRVRKYSDLVTTDSFENAALAEMKDNAKDILDEVKDEVKQIKSEVDNWRPNHTSTTSRT